jgi:hypothetical protein
LGVVGIALANGSNPTKLTVRIENITKPDGTAGGSLFRQNVPSKCFPIPDTEVDTNPNF